MHAHGCTRDSFLLLPHTNTTSDKPFLAKRSVLTIPSAAEDPAKRRSPCHSYSSIVQPVAGHQLWWRLQRAACKLISFPAGRRLLFAFIALLMHGLRIHLLPQGGRPENLYLPTPLDRSVS